jgi:hypothetical protein
MHGCDQNTTDLAGHVDCLPSFLRFSDRIAPPLETLETRGADVLVPRATLLRCVATAGRMTLIVGLDGLQFCLDARMLVPRSASVVDQLASEQASSFFQRIDPPLPFPPPAAAPSRPTPTTRAAG